MVRLAATEPFRKLAHELPDPSGHHFGAARRHLRLERLV